MIRFIIMGMVITTFSEPKYIESIMDKKPQPYWYVCMEKDNETICWWQDKPIVKYNAPH